VGIGLSIDGFGRLQQWDQLNATRLLIDELTKKEEEEEGERVRESNEQRKVMWCE
jgi:hypothetical protein